MAFSEVELALRKELLKAVAERDKIATTCVTLRAEVLDLKTKVAKHEEVHTICADAINQLTSKNAALEELAGWLRWVLLLAEMTVETTRPEQSEDTPVQLLLKQKLLEASAACDQLGVSSRPDKDAYPPKELTP